MSALSGCRSFRLALTSPEVRKLSINEDDWRDILMGCTTVSTIHNINIIFIYSMQIYIYIYIYINMIMNRVLCNTWISNILTIHIYMYVCYSISIYTSMQSVCYPIRWVNVLQPKNNIPFSRCLVCHHRI